MKNILKSHAVTLLAGLVLGAFITSMFYSISPDAAITSPTTGPTASPTARPTTSPRVSILPSSSPTRASTPPSPPPTINSCRKGDDVAWRETLRADINSALKKELEDQFTSTYNKVSQDHKIDGDEHRKLLLRALTISTADRDFQNKAGQFINSNFYSVYNALNDLWNTKVPFINAKAGSLAESAATKFLDQKVNNYLYGEEDSAKTILATYNVPKLEIILEANLKKFSNSLSGSVECRYGLITGQPDVSIDLTWKIRQLRGARLKFTSTQSGKFGATVNWSKNL